MYLLFVRRRFGATGDTYDIAGVFETLVRAQEATGDQDWAQIALVTGSNVEMVCVKCAGGSWHEPDRSIL